MDFEQHWIWMLYLWQLHRLGNRIIYYQFTDFNFVGKEPEDDKQVNKEHPPQSCRWTTAWTWSMCHTKGQVTGSRQK